MTARGHYFDLYVSGSELVRVKMQQRLSPFEVCATCVQQGEFLLRDRGILRNAEVESVQVIFRLRRVLGRYREPKRVGAAK